MTEDVLMWGGPLDNQMEQVHLRSDGHLPPVLQVFSWDGVHTYELMRLVDEQGEDTGQRRYEHRGLSLPIG